MKSKLTLRLEESLIRQAKKYAKKRGTSVSKLVADYFTVISEKQSTPETEELPPLTASLSGILVSNVMTEEEYKNFLEEKYLK